jgi:ribosomal protein S1
VNGERLVLLPEDRIVTGTVQHIKSRVIQVTIGKREPLVLSIQAAGEKGTASLKPGDQLTIIVSDENETVDFHQTQQPG